MCRVGSVSPVEKPLSLFASVMVLPRSRWCRSGAARRVGLQTPARRPQFRSSCRARSPAPDRDRGSARKADLRDSRGLFVTLLMLVTPVITEPLSRDHLKVAMPGANTVGGTALALGRSRLMDLDAIQLVLHPGVVGPGGQAAGTGRRSRRRSGRQQARGCRRRPAGNIESQVAPGLLPRSSNCTCHTVCRRPVESTATAFSMRLGSFRKSTGLTQTSR